MFDGGESLVVRGPNKMIITKNIEAQVVEEISRAVNQHIENIDEGCSNDTLYIRFRKM